MLEKLLRAVALGQEVHRAAEPVVGAALRGEAGRSVLVLGVRRDAVLGHVLHHLRPDLQLDALRAGADHGRVQGLVVVLLRVRDVVLEAPGDGRPGRVHDAERPVAIVGAVHDDPEAVDVGQLLEGDRLPLHLAPDRVRLLAAPGHDGLDLLRAELRHQAGRHLLDQLAVPVGQVLQALADGGVRLGVQVAEGQVLELVADLLDAHAAGERCVDVQRLLGDAGALLRRHEAQRAHVVQPVGELDEKHPKVCRDREQQLAEVLALRGLFRDKVEALELGQPVDQRADLGPEGPVDLLQRRGRVLDGVVQHGSHDGRRVEPEVGQDPGHLERMRDVGVARGGPLLVAVRHHRVDVGPVEEGLVGIRVVALHPLDQLVLTHHLGRDVSPIDRPDRSTAATAAAMQNREIVQRYSGGMGRTTPSRRCRRPPDVARPAVASPLPPVRWRTEMLVRLRVDR